MQNYRWILCWVELTPDSGMIMEIEIETTYLYRQSASGKLQIWTIHSEDDEIVIQWGDLCGAQQEQREVVDFGLAGRSQFEQMMSRINSRINKKLDRGYTRNRLAAENNKPTNALGLRRPMLAARYNTVKEIDFDRSKLQLKYDGHRCLIHFDGDEYTAYSRNGKPIEIIHEILAAVKLSGLKPGETLDGELYHHGTPLQTITSWAKRRQQNTRKLSYIVYDMIPSAEVVSKLWFDDRYSKLISMCLPSPIYIALTSQCVAEIDIADAMKNARSSGYEGLIIRQPNMPYQDGKRSNGIVKVKTWLDDEFKVIEILESNDGWARLRCEMPNGKIFGCSAPGTMEEKCKVWINQHLYLDKYVRVEYANLTAEGKPFHPIATMWRDKSAE